MLDGEAYIIKCAVGGDSSAFGLLYDHYQPKIYRFALVKVSHREEAEDLTHQVFLKAWQNIESYQDLGFPFSSWLYRIARNHVVDYYRTKKITESIEDIDPKKTPVEHSVHSNLLEKLEIERVKNAIGKLKPEYQDVIIMRFIEDLPIRETALALDKSEGAVKLLQHRAIKELKKALSGSIQD
ncbi:MAG: hypothetical protein A3B25_00910 [Candidatus Ryanbacteria bacterium RIFCSPLOWO2_01_FULL_48_26]|uniref:RNA polymerase sigma factor n=1 Tax=Candidatus Ryanbacteria bacterium RIFCSPLOWO2_01_FULL_48_26 TaxID=1802126 RepID=A0A1G2GS14_9BACT|nr:MAG: hypothetical protein A3B25_00910 [Candidatus Ryanbacteria bacterium RIFCSPLOWO2_01_FULL_48_26]